MNYNNFTKKAAITYLKSNYPNINHISIEEESAKKNNPVTRYSLFVVLNHNNNIYYNRLVSHNFEDIVNGYEVKNNDFISRFDSIQKHCKNHNIDKTIDFFEFQISAKFFYENNYWYEKSSKDWEDTQTYISGLIEKYDNIEDILKDLDYSKILG